MNKQVLRSKVGKCFVRVGKFIRVGTFLEDNDKEEGNGETFGSICFQNNNGKCGTAQMYRGTAITGGFRCSKGGS